MPSAPRTTLLTGSTGFIGQYVLRDLLARGERVVVMLREPEGLSRMRLAEIMQPLGVDIHPAIAQGQLLIVQGALPKQLPPETDLRIDRILHSAACLQVQRTDPGEPFATNVDGVKALAAWAQRLDVPQFYYVSTAYTCGRDARTAHEQFHVPRPRFATDYEHSKWLAEDFLRFWSQRCGIELTVLRPSLVIGDSQTGYTTQYGGFYQLARMIEVLKQFFHDPAGSDQLILPMRIPANPLAPQNLVPVDYVVQVIVHILDDPRLGGHIYHITNPQPPTNAQVKQWLEEYYGITGGRFVDSLDRAVSESLAEDMFMQMSHLIFEQMRFVPDFDCSNTHAALRDTALPFPRLDREAMFRMLRYAQATGWGRQAQAFAS